MVLCRQVVPSFLNISIFLIIILISSGHSWRTDIQKAIKKLECDIKTSDPAEQIRKSDLVISSPYFGILSEAKLKISSDSDCLHDIQKILDGIISREVWALKIYDASGTPTSNFLFGQNFWYGSEKACKRLNYELTNPLGLDHGDMNSKLFVSTSPFRTNYVLVYANYSCRFQFPLVSSVKVPIEWGICIPHSCATNDILDISRSYFQKNQLEFQKIYDINIDVIEVKTLSWKRFFQRLDVVAILVGLALITAFVVLMNIIPESQHPTFQRIQNCFLFQKNLKNLLSTAVPPNAISIIDSMRTITCLIIIGVHILYFSLFAFSNQSELIFKIYDIFAQVFLLSAIYVDIFFVISGFLLVYNFLKNEQQKKEIEANNITKNLKLFTKHVLHRYLRLTPAIIFVTGLSHLVAVYLKENTIYFIEDNFDLYCRNNYWWRNLLYVQGYFSADDMCGTWTWYLSADMQYFIICLVGLFIYIKYPKLAKTLFIVLSLGSIAVTWYINYKEKFKFNIDETISKRDIIYSPPWVRMNPYFGGILGGYFFHKLQSTGIKIKPYVDYMWGVLSIGILVGFMSGMQFQNSIPGMVFQIQNSLGRYLLGCYISISIFIVHFGHGGIFRKFLTHTRKIFYHLNKLTYMMYLLNPIIIAIVQGIQDQPTVIANARLSMDLIGVMVICYVVSIISSLFFEIPYCRLSSEFLMKNNKKSKPKS